MTMNHNLAEKKGTDLFGCVAVAMVTPFNEEGALDLDAGAALASHLVSQGIDSLILAGTTGESPTTTLEEKILFLKEMRRVLGDKIRLIAGASTNNTAASVTLARASAEAGADGLLLVAPYYSKPSQEGIYQHFLSLANATDLPVCIYDIPGRCGIEVSSDTMKRLAEHKNVRAVKDAKGNLGAAATLMRQTGLAWYSGDDPLNLPWLSLGASGFISVIGHLAPAALRDLYTSFDTGDLASARSINASLAPLMAAQARLGGVTMAKAALALQGIPVGRPRLPVMAASEDELTLLHRDMELAGVL